MGKQKHDDLAIAVAEKSFIDKNFLKPMLGIGALAAVMAAAIIFLAGLRKSKSKSIRLTVLF